MGIGESQGSFPLFPGRYFDFEGIGMIASIAGFIDGGKSSSYAWTASMKQSRHHFSVSPAERNDRHGA